MSELLVGLSSDVVGLHPVVDNFGEFLFEGSSLHLGLSLEKLHDKNLGETFLDLVIGIPVSWHELKEIDLGAS